MAEQNLEQAIATPSSYQMRPPDSFNFKCPAEWTRWIRRFERFRSSSGLINRDESTQVNTLLYTMGDEADDILTAFNLTDQEQNSYETVKASFEAHFIVRRNIIYERAKFNQRKQGPSETVDSFVTELYCLAEHCEYGVLKDEMIRDRIVVGLSDAKLSESLQLDPDLTLTRAIAKARQSETVRAQQNVVRGIDSVPGCDVNIDAIKRRGRSFFNKMKQPSQLTNTHQKKSQSTLSSKHSSEKCTRCGKSPSHRWKDCPARNSVCNKCLRKGHYGIVCFAVNNVEINDQSEDRNEYFLGTVRTKSDNDEWNICITLGERNLEFKIDTGADVNVISEKDFNTLKGVQLQDTNIVLYGPGQKNLPVLGKFQTKMLLGEKESCQEIFVIKELHKPLLGRPAIGALSILARINAAAVKHPEDDFPELFEGLGVLRGGYQHKIQLKEGAVPFAITCPRRVPIPMMDAVRKELERMVKLGVISPVEEPTDWCSGMVVVPKPDGTVRICVDLTRLNQNVKRERYIMPAVEYTLGQLSEARIFSKLDANCGFWQIELSPESSRLTTFLSPYGRFSYNRIPYGLVSAPEIYQRTMHKILQGLPGVTGQMDDTLVYAGEIPEHDSRLRKSLERIKESGMTLNKRKCEFRKTEVVFLGQKISAGRVEPCQEKIEAILQMPAPQNVGDIKRFLGMANYLGKFIPHLAEKARPLNELLRSRNAWIWDVPQNAALEQIKQDLVSSPVLCLYDSKLPTRITTDASSYGLGCVLEQFHEPEWNSVAFASKTLSDTERRYSAIEKEALGVTWGCEKFKDFLLGIPFHIITDHKPLVPLLSTKQLDELSPRLQRFRMRLMRYSYTISHAPGKDVVVADALSRAPQPPGDVDDFEVEVEAYVNSLLQGFPISDGKLEELRKKQRSDEICQRISDATMNGWGEKETTRPDLKPYWQYRADFSVQHDLLLKGQQLLIPKAMQSEILDRIHEGHQGISKCKRRARESVWWLGLGKAIADKVQSCNSCRKTSIEKTEPMIPSELPDRPWQKVGTDLLEFKGHKYLVVVDYYSRYIEMSPLPSITSQAVINSLKSIFARHGIAELVYSDNGTQYSSEQFKLFAKEYNFKHITSSPKYPKSNGQAEATVKIVKNILKKCKDPYLGLLAYRNTPLEEGCSPAELLMGRRLRTTLPAPQVTLIPKLPNLKKFKKRNEKRKASQKRQYDTRHGVKVLPPLQRNEPVWIPEMNRAGKVVCGTPYPRSYLVETPVGTLRRNRAQVRPLMEKSPTIQETRESLCAPNSDSTPASASPESSRASDHVRDIVYRTRSGRASIPPRRLVL